MQKRVVDIIMDELLEQGIDQVYAVVCVTSGPGATNTLTGVVGAWQDSIPMLILSGQVRDEISVAKSGLPLRYRGIQEFEIVPT